MEIPVVKSGQPAALLCWEVVYTVKRKPRLRWSWPTWHWLSCWSTLNFWAAQLQLHPAVCTAAGMQVAARYAASSGLWAQGRPPCCHHRNHRDRDVIRLHPQLFWTIQLLSPPTQIQTLPSPRHVCTSGEKSVRETLKDYLYSAQSIQCSGFISVDTLWTIPKVQSWDGRWRSSHQCIGSPALYPRHSWNKMMIWPIL